MNVPSDKSSGGERSRLALACVLLSVPEVLLLDEPTNHLDDSATEHLRRMLMSWSGPVLVASHDRVFLDEVATTIMDLDPAPRPHADTPPLAQDGPETGIGVTRFVGSCTAYLAARLDTQKRWQDRYDREQDELARARNRVRESRQLGHPGRAPRTEGGATAKFYADRHATTVSRRVSGAQAHLEALKRDQVREPPNILRFSGLSAAWNDVEHAPMSGVIVAVSRAGVSGRLAPISASLSHGDRLLVTGPNGSGKSTLLRLLAGLMDPTTGTVTMGHRTRTGLLGQDVTVGAQPDSDLTSPRRMAPNVTVSEAYREFVGPDRAAACPLTTLGLLGGSDLQRPISLLSTGQRRRFELALLLADPPDVLLLDEPTNHFSLLLVAQLESEIPRYPGTVVVASHDRWLRRTWTGQHLALTSGATSALC